MRVRLGDYVKIKTGKLDANAADDDGTYPFFTCSVEPLKINQYAYDCECVLVAGNGDLNVKYYNGKFNAYQRTYIIESKDKRILSVPYLYSFLDKHVETLREESVGGVIKYIKLANLTEAEICLPSEDEQNRIVNEINKVDLLIKKRKQQLEKLDLLVKSQFIEMFGDPKVNCHKWQMSTIGELFRVSSGGTPTTGVGEYWENGTIPWIGSNMCQDTVLYENDGKFITEEGYAHSSAKWFYNGTVLVALVGATIGKTALLRFDTTTNQNIVGIDVNGNQNFLSEFIFYQLQMQYGKFMEIGNGKFKMANQGFIRNLPCMCPPIELQTQFAAFVEQTEKTKSTIRHSLDKLTILKNALMQKYFG